MSGADDSEIINLSYASLSLTESGQFFIKPMGGIDLVASEGESLLYGC